MPPLDPGLTNAPAEIHLAAFAYGEEVDEAHRQIFHFDAELLHLFDQSRDRLTELGERCALLLQLLGLSEVTIALAFSLDEIDVPLQLLEGERAPLHLFHERTDLREHAIGVVASKVPRQRVDISEGRSRRMPLYVLLTKVTSHGIKTIRDNPQRIKEVNREVEQLGARVLTQYATLGRYDFINIVEASNVETIAKISVNLGARGTVQIETLPAIPIEDFVKGLRPPRKK